MQTLTKKADVEIQRDVRRELEWDPRVEANEIGVSVKAGVVTLTGRVASRAEKLAAEEAAHRVCGVLDVASEVRATMGAERTGLPGADVDAGEIKRAIERALERQVERKARRIAVTVEGGNRVVLTGNVDSWAERQAIVGAAVGVAGVGDVDVRLQVASGVSRPSRSRAACR